MIPLILNNKDILLETHQTPLFQGSPPSLALEAVESCAAAFPTWSHTTPSHRRNLLNKVAQLLRSREDEFRSCIEAEVHMDAIFSKINVDVGAALVEETAAVISEAMTGSMPVSEGESYAMVFKEPVGVVLGIAPWNAPVILGLRAIVAAVAGGNTVVFRGSELSPRTHYLVAGLFRDAGFPPGVVNFLLHRPEDAPELFDVMINHVAVKKCNFTGSTNVGRIIGSKAALALKPVLLELGGKNFVLVLEDADVAAAAEQILLGAMLNNGQICMSTDLVYVVDSIAPALTDAIVTRLQHKTNHRIINPQTKHRLDHLITDARSKGATIHQAPTTPTSELDYPATVIENLTPSMDFHSIESFGPLMGIVPVKDETEAVALSQQSQYGLSAAIFTASHFRALKLAERIRAGAVHVNSMTVHDEATLPHGGMGESGFGRFGGKWGVDEFLQTRMVILNQ